MRVSGVRGAKRRAKQGKKGGIGGEGAGAIKRDNKMIITEHLSHTDIILD